MKALLVTALLGFSAVSQAHVYDCVYSVETAKGLEPKANFTLNTDTEQNKFVQVGGGAVGCLVFNSTPQQLACSVGLDEKNTYIMSVQNGTPALYTQMIKDGQTLEFKCLKK